MYKETVSGGAGAKTALVEKWTYKPVGKQTRELTFHDMQLTNIKFLEPWHPKTGTAFPGFLPKYNKK